MADEMNGGVAPAAPAAPEPALAPPPSASADIGSIMTEYGQPAPAESVGGAALVAPVPAATDPWARLLAEDAPEDPFAILLDQDRWGQALRQPAALAELPNQLRPAVEQARQMNGLREAAETRLGGVDRATFAIEAMGDLLRGGFEIDPQERGEGGPATYVDRFLDRLRTESDKSYYQLVAAAIDSSPETLRANQDLVLEVLGLDPRYIDDYRSVARAGGFVAPEEAAAESEWLQQNLDPSLHSVFRKLPADVRIDLRAQQPGVARFHLENHARQQAFEQRQQQEVEQRRQHQEQEQEWKAASGLAERTRTVFEEYVQRGVSVGLSQFEAAGAAAMAYSEIEKAYWQEGSEARRVMDNLQRQIRSGNALQADAGRRAYQKLFETTYRRILQSHRAPAPAAPPAGQQGQDRRTAPGAQSAQFAPSSPSATLPPNDILSIIAEHGAFGAGL